MPEVLRTETVFDASGQPKLNVYLNQYPPLFMARMIVLYTFTLTMILVLVFSKPYRTTDKKVIANSPTKVNGQPEKNSPIASGDISSDRFSVEIEPGKVSGLNGILNPTIYLKVKGVVPKGTKYIARFKRPNEKFDFEITYDETFLDKGTKFDVSGEIGTHEYKVTIIDYETEKVVVSKTVTLTLH